MLNQINNSVEEDGFFFEDEEEVFINGEFVELTDSLRAVYIEGANALASDDAGGKLRDMLFRAIVDAMRSPYGAFLAGKVLSLLEEQQMQGGLTEMTFRLCIANASLSRECKRLTERQKESVWRILRLSCPLRNVDDDGIKYLGIPYKLAKNGEPVSYGKYRSAS